MDEKLQDERQGLDEGQVVPVSEAIRYRKRAQVAEQQVEKLSKQLSETRQEFDDVCRRLDETRVEGELTEQLVDAGVNDMEVARLLVKKRLDGVADDGHDVASVVDKLKSERPGLFDGQEQNDNIVPGPTAGVRGSNDAGKGTLSRLASKASESHSRKDLQEYMRLRRGFVG